MVPRRGSGLLVRAPLRRHRHRQPGRGDVLVRARVSFEEPTDEDMAARRTIIDTDPPEHTKLRKIVSGAFSQRAVAVYEHFITELTGHVLDRAVDHRPVIPLDGAGVAVDVGTVPFDPRVDVRRL